MKIIGRLILLAVVIAALLVGYNAIKKMVYMQIYPLKYNDEIVYNANEYELDSYLVASLIWVESKYIPDALSASGAMGLMQIMPETGEWIAKKLDMESFDKSALMDPKTNIMMGCWYLDYLDERFAGDVNNMMAAYNGGPNRVANWLEDESITIDGELVNIPLQETKDYIVRIKETYEIYTTYYTFE